jgi:hypothetical protein
MRHLPVPALRSIALAFLAFAPFLPDMAHAYVGPGAGLTAIGTVLALIAAVVLALVGFVWYPLKRLFRRPSSATPRAGHEGDPK